MYIDCYCKAVTNKIVLQADLLSLEKNCILCDVIANLFLSRVNIIHCSHV